MKHVSTAFAIILFSLVRQSLLAIEPDTSTAVQVPIAGKQGTVAVPAVFYRRIVDGDLVITVPEDKGDATASPLL